MLNEAEKNDRLLAHVFSLLDTQYRRAEQLELASTLATILGPIR